MFFTLFKQRPFKSMSIQSMPVCTIFYSSGIATSFKLAAFQQGSLYF